MKRKKLRDKWVRRSDSVIMLMICMYFIGALWGMGIVTIQAVRSDYVTDVGGVLQYIGIPVSGGVITWLVKNLAENISKHKHNPDYLRTHLPDEYDDEYDENNENNENMEENYDRPDPDNAGGDYADDGGDYGVAHTPHPRQADRNAERETDHVD